MRYIDSPIFVFNAGGLGDVPIPLIKGEIPHGEKPIPFRHKLSFCGQFRNIRERASQKLKDMFQNKYKHCDPKNWIQDLMESEFAIAMRGFGRTSFMLNELLQLGKIPIYVTSAWYCIQIYFEIYKDFPWLPYRDLWRKYGILIDYERNLTSLPEILSQIDSKEYHKRVKTIKELRESHFTYNGVISQILCFIQKDCNSDLREIPRRLENTGAHA